MIMTGMGKKRRAVYISSESEDSNTDSEVEGSKISKKCGVISISSIKNITSSSEKGENMNATKTRLCENLLRKLMSHKDGWLFNRPVDPVVLRIPDYFDIIHNPMDLGTVKKKLASKQYMSTHEFAADVRLTFSNAMRYNPPGNDVHVIAKHLNNIFNLEWKLLERKWGKGNLVPEEHPMKITKVQAAVTSKPAIPKRLTVCSGSTGRNFITNAKSSKSAQVIRKFASRGSERASAKDMLFQVVAGGEGCLQHPVSCTKEYAKVSRVQVGEQSSGLNGKGPQSYCDSSTSPIASSEQGEENSLHDEPLSPSKALRAAMLRSRFAGTIVKAQQKALLDHGKKIDPGKLQLEKEKLERRQQEEKARIEAQVKAAEAAAQLQIETEMRMKREREREAARLALQMMKKTVDIDNTDFVKDVENLSKRCRLNTPGKLIVDFVNGIEQPPDLRSPLEQLGLFIKKDLEEEVESEWEDCISPTVNADVEEGEIG